MKKVTVGTDDKHPQPKLSTKIVSIAIIRIIKGLHAFDTTTYTAIIILYTSYVIIVQKFLRDVVRKYWSLTIP